MPKIKLEVTGTIVDIHPSITPDRLAAALDRQFRYLEDPGFCVHCGAEASNVEPDAKGYRCGACGLCGVYGAEELLIVIA